MQVSTLALYALAGVLAMMIAWLTVSFQTLKAATANPVEVFKVTSA